MMFENYSLHLQLHRFTAAEHIGLVNLFYVGRGGRKLTWRNDLRRIHKPIITCWQGPRMKTYRVMRHFSMIKASSGDTHIRPGPTIEPNNLATITFLGRQVLPGRCQLAVHGFKRPWQRIRQDHMMALGGRTHIQDRKSTRLNSSHVASSCAVLCLSKR